LNNKIRAKAQRLGFCCEYAMLIAYKDKPRDFVKMKTKLSERTVWYSYAKLAAGTLKCGEPVNRETCLLVPAAKDVRIKK
jgi:hypothetical protein